MRARNSAFSALFVISFLFSLRATGQIDSVGSGRGLHFDGVDDFVELSTVFDSLEVPVTISAWIKLDQNSAGISPIFVRQDVDDTHDELTFYVTSTQIVIGFGNGVVPGIPVFRRSKGSSFQGLAGRWAHVAGIIRSPDQMEIFVNGINVGGSFSGNSNLAIITSRYSQTRIGYWLNSDIRSRFQGSIDEVQVWNKALSETEIRTNMCHKLAGNEEGLIGYWNFDEEIGALVFDHSAGDHQGFLSGSPQRIYSGAPIGDESTAIYPDTWTGLASSISLGRSKMTISNVRSNPAGIHLYSVRNLPSQKGGLNLARVSAPYFGVFVASLDTENLFDAELDYDGSPATIGSFRDNNSVPVWKDLTLPAADLRTQIELIRQCPASNIQLELGQDKILCDENSFIINSGNNPAMNSILWSTGETSGEILVTHSGTYWVKVGECDAKKDSVKISFYKTPQPISLGNDIIECAFDRKVLDLDVDTAGFEFKWQDGSALDTFAVANFGVYWVTVFNACGSVSDTIDIRKPWINPRDIPNIITPNGDSHNQRFLVPDILKGQVSLQIFNRWGDQVAIRKQYDNSWEGDDLGSGIYYLRLNGDCIEYDAPLTIIR